MGHDVEYVAPLRIEADLLVLLFPPVRRRVPFTSAALTFARW